MTYPNPRRSVLGLAAATLLCCGEASQDGQVRLFFEVSNYGTDALQAEVSILAGDAPSISVPVSVEPGGRFRDGLRVDVGEGVGVTAQLTHPDGTPLGDGNPLDDSSFLEEDVSEIEPIELESAPESAPGQTQFC